MYGVNPLRLFPFFYYSFHLPDFNFQNSNHLHVNTKSPLLSGTIVLTAFLFRALLIQSQS